MAENRGSVLALSRRSIWPLGSFVGVPFHSFLEMLMEAIDRKSWIINLAWNKLKITSTLLKKIHKEPSFSCRLER